ncbi:MAG TPA: secondary thiamine-phosphate synthase enzyme YjbQ [Dissulfurispiraceae bacterium]|nr:secondary thiamine-phosphate synthase enzyme YjbQ [Dissulfurispiraceae bacterium]
MKQTISVNSRSRTEFIDITAEVQEALGKSGAKYGACLIFVPHTTAGITINEGADPSVKRDMLRSLDRLIPLDGDYKHAEGNSAAHIKTALVGTSVTCIVEDGRAVLGTWQSIFFCEFDGPRNRKVHLKYFPG